MTQNVKVRTLKGFINDGRYTGRGREIEVDEQRARELERNGLITRDAKAAPPHSNKMAPVHSDKDAATATPAEQLVSGTAAEVIAGLDAVTDVELARAALAAEQAEAGKKRKSVLEALTARIAALEQPQA